MLLQRKNERREASSRSLTRYAVFGATSGGILLDAEEKLRADQHGAQRHLDAASKSALRARLFIELQRHLQIGVGHRPPIGAAHQRRKDALRAAFFLARLRRLADEDAAAAGRVAGALRIVRTIDRDRIDRRLDARMPVHIEVRLVRLALGFEQREGFFGKAAADSVRTGFDRDARRSGPDRRRDDRCRSGGGLTVNSRTRSPIQHQLHLVRLGREPSTCSLRSRCSRSWNSYSASSGKV